MLDNLEGLARKIAPIDLPADVPLYVVGASEGPPEMAGRSAGGATAPWLDIASREWLQSTGRWRGRGVMIWLNDSFIRQTSLHDADGDEAFADELCRGRLTATFVHEVAHALSKPLELDDNAYPASAVPLMRAVMAGPTTALATPTENAPPAEPWEGHRADFLRVLCHVVDRAERLLGERLPGEWMFSRSYGVAPLCIYRDVLLDELETAADDSFAEIRERPLSEPLLKLWRLDVVRYHRYFKEQVT